VRGQVALRGGFRLQLPGPGFDGLPS
jgi:hypothetical protein